MLTIQVEAAVRACASTIDWNWGLRLSLMNRILTSQGRLVDKPVDQASAPVQDDNPMLAPRYREIATFMRAPLCHDPVGLDIALIGVPFEGGGDEPVGCSARAAREQKHVELDACDTSCHQGQPL
jgi:hypothetical protein